MRRALAVLSLLWATGVQAIEWQPDPQVPLQVEVAETMREFRARSPELEPYFMEACAIVVFPRVIRAGLGLGGGGGRGLLLYNGKVHGEVSQGAFSLGLQAGVQTFRQLIFFRTCEAMQEFTTTGNLGALSGRVELAGRASAQAGRSGASMDPGFTSDVALFSLSRGGLMLELAAAGVRYRFTPTVETRELTD
jgi:lipid-binding SYLF domain-containing protein